MDPADLPGEYVKRLRAVEAKRPRTVIEEILKHGYVTTERLGELGYNHPPRAARDVRELGFPLETTRVTSSDGRSIGAYVFADPATIKRGTLDGRKVWPKELKTALVQRDDCRCNVCLEPYEDRYLQIDHRIPFEVSGDDGSMDPTHFQLLCASCNRSKSWSCEHCPNFVQRDDTVCETCYWADSQVYEHVATRPERRATVVWSGDEEVRAFDEARARAEAAGIGVVAWLKRRRR
ncbi:MULTISPECIES: HNH endonuclease [unclassified Modestobacter]|uniref:HNH endonuclease n=1 Tax=unclassified Modestobacter TaxID=2643866 RepID=UPI0022AA9735|nr:MULTISPECIES: HNH endonuclease signature motif containing protein [unclassified Modestobacter]MCZ2826042.1 HNH endonuclease signature motif containing protein [Modestobacter sp. VKM Ac-2981]MCZ2852893.1 HNH endonuclease signature motif containing protein [Modestobacter sp. VKM Ac-2982]